MTVSLMCHANQFPRLIGQPEALVSKGNQFLHAVDLKGLSWCTGRAYGWDLVVFFRWLEESKKRFHSFTYSDLLEFINYQRKRNAAPNSINRLITTVQVLYRFCYDKPLSNAPGRTGLARYKSPAQHFLQGVGFRLSKKPYQNLTVRVPRKIVEPLTVKQVDTFFSTLKRYRDLAIAQLMLLCGLRFTEVLTLKMSGVDFVDKQIRVLGKGNKERVLPLPEIIVATLERYLRYERPRDCTTKRFFVILQGNGRGEPISQAGLRSLFRHRRLNTDLQNANPHRFRHTFGANMAKEKVPLAVLQRLLGHYDPSTTMKYVHLSMSDIADEFTQALRKIQARYEHSL